LRGTELIYLQKGAGSDVSRREVGTEQQRKLEHQYVNSAKENAVQLSFVEFRYFYSEPHCTFQIIVQRV
jgi:hypothetical protein